MLTLRTLLLIAAIALFLAAAFGAAGWVDGVNYNLFVALGLASAAGSRLP